MHATQQDTVYRNGLEGTYACVTIQYSTTCPGLFICSIIEIIRKDKCKHSEYAILVYMEACMQTSCAV